VKLLPLYNRFILCTLRVSASKALSGMVWGLSKIPSPLLDSLSRVGARQLPSCLDGKAKTSYLRIKSPAVLESKPNLRSSSSSSLFSQRKIDEGIGLASPNSVYTKIAMEINYYNSSPNTTFSSLLLLLLLLLDCHAMLLHICMTNFFS
jgi:hypothetical protein